jgi:hypothetical protein
LTTTYKHANALWYLQGTQVNTGNTIIATVAGVYTLVVKDNGCAATSTVTGNFKMLPQNHTLVTSYDTSGSTTTGVGTGAGSVTTGNYPKMLFLIFSGTSSTPDIVTATSSGSKTNVGGIIGGVIGGLVGILLIILIILRRLKKRKQAALDTVLINSPPKSPGLTTVKDIVVKTRLGGGYFSDVYKGEWQVQNNSS